MTRQRYLWEVPCPGSPLDFVWNSKAYAVTEGHKIVNPSTGRIYTEDEARALKKSEDAILQTNPEYRCIYKELVIRYDYVGTWVRK